MELGLRIRAWRRWKRLTQRELAVRARLSPATICQLESDKYETNPSSKTITAIVGALDLTIEKFYGRTPNERAA